MKDQPDVIPLVEESATVAKRQVTTGRVSVRTSTDTFEEMERVELEAQDLEVERVAINKEVTSVPAVRIEGDVTIIPILEEVVVVKKRLMLREEVRLTRRVTKEEVDVPVTLRKQRADVEHTDLTRPNHKG